MQIKMTYLSIADGVHCNIGHASVLDRFALDVAVR